MKFLKSYRTLFCLSVVGCAAASVALAFIPFGDNLPEKYKGVFSYAFAAAFWIGLVFEIVFFILSAKRGKAIEKKLVSTGSKSLKGSRPGVISFFTCKEAAVADCLFAASVVTIVSFGVFKISNDLLFAVTTVILFLSFNMHCILNGRNYKYIKELQKYLKTQGAKKDE